MDTRYTDTYIADLWSRTYQLTLWAAIETETALAQSRHEVIPKDAARAIQAGLATLVEHLHEPDLRRRLLFSLDATEADTRHDVVAFLRCAGDFIGNHGSAFLHYGLTSSDLVDTALAIRLRQAEGHIDELARRLVAVMAAGIAEHARTPILGRTHSQSAEPTTLGLRFFRWTQTLTTALAVAESIAPSVQTGKLSGPVGAYAHSPVDVESEVSARLGFYTTPGECSQVVPRQSLSAYANGLAGIVGACAQIALDFRLMAARGEAHEHFGPHQVGSSSMPHKRNPVTAEQISGLVRMARGYAAMLQPAELWEERDISHSCVERVAVPDLLHTVAHALNQTRVLLANARWDTGQMAKALKEADRQPYSAWKTLQLVQAGYPRHQAEHLAAEWAREGCFGTDHDHPDPLQLLAGAPVVHAGATTEELHRDLDSILGNGDRFGSGDVPGQPCQPIGCDAGYHLPGCQYIQEGDRVLDTEASGQVG